MNLTRWNPFSELEDFQRRILKGTSLPLTLGEEPYTQAQWAPAVDISEDDRAYTIKAELPEIKKEDLKVHFENGILSLAGERRFNREEKNKKIHRTERFYGNFMRSFSLPVDIDSTRIHAEYKDGLLTITAPKAEGSKPKQIDVKIS